MEETLIQAGPPAPRRRGRISARGKNHDGEAVLGRYVLLERLGSGGFGEVFRARDELLQREVALKRVPLGADDDGERAAREAHAAARLSHPAIVALYEAAAEEDAFYLISELVHGSDLARLVHEQELDDDHVIEIGLALAGALEHAHARGVVHRDVKPHNVLVPERPEGPAGVAKLTDFGGASLAGEDALTRTGDVIGTLAYMAPEQSEGREAGPEADLYSLALVLYEALTGANPVRGATPAETARRIGRRIAPLERHRRDLPRALTRAIDRALGSSPHERGTPAELAAALEDALEARPSPAPGPRPLPLSRAVQPRSPRHLLRGQAPAATVPGAAGGTLVQGALAPPSRLVLPRAIWLAAALALVGWQAAAGRPGVALLLCAGLAPLAALPRRGGPWWLCALAAPALGWLGLAGAFPTAAGQLRGWRSRAALGALGYWWLLLAEPLTGRRLWLGLPAHLPTRAVWEPSLGSAASHVVGPLLAPGAALGALLWALGAASLPLLVRGRSAALDLLAAAGWSAALALAAPSLDGGLPAHGAVADGRGAVLGAVLGGVGAVAARALRGPVRGHRA